MRLIIEMIIFFCFKRDVFPLQSKNYLGYINVDDRYPQNKLKISLDRLGKKRIYESR